jgi:carboxyl-terminal processing protease
MPQRNLLILLVGLAVSYVCYVRGEQDPYARFVARGLAEIESDALASVPSKQLFNRAVEAMVDVLHQSGDQHSQFIPSDEADPYQAEMKQQFGGIGVRIRLLGEPPELVVIGAPDPNTPAARADVRANDRILSVDDKPIAGMKLSDILHLMRGQPGQSVRLLIRHADAQHPEVKELVREVVTIDSVLGDRRNPDGSWEFRLKADPRIAQLRVTSFGNKTADELDRVLTRLTGEGVQAIVLDLRDDAGGALDAAVAVCDMFLPAGKVIVEIRGRDDVLVDRYVSSGSGRFSDLPLAALVNQNSASASEIVAACLQDHGRAVVLGTRSFGKGTVQQLIPIEAGRSLLKLTTASYRRPNGKNIHRYPTAKESDDWGVSPDPGRAVPLADKDYESYLKYRSERDLWGDPPPEDKTTGRAGGADFVDRQLDAAAEYLESLLDAEKSA